ncbi:hypothetical protein ACWIGW_44095 [Nocardia brasiliensis]|uniref:hypothetical protein n=1 Tax=Streptomyces sp. NPDC056056 TaxID=3345698 RepID=UPI0035D8C74C
MSRKEPMTQDRAARIQSAAARDPHSASARSGFAERAQSSADKAAHEQESSRSDRR